MRVVRLDFSLDIEATGSMSEPDLRSRRLCAGRRVGQIQAPPTLVLELPPDSSFDVNEIRFRHFISGSLAFDFADLT